MTTKANITIRKRNDRVRTSITFPDKTMAKQSFADECNINTIMSKYQKTGLIDHVNRVAGSYGDFTSVQDYQLSLNQVIQAQDAFDQLPSTVRKRFGNNPSELMAFLQDPDNRDEAVKLGLVEAPPPQPKEPDKARQEGSESPPRKDQGAEPPPPNKGP